MSFSHTQTLLSPRHLVYSSRPKKQSLQKTRCLPAIEGLSPFANKPLGDMQSITITPIIS